MTDRPSCLAHYAQGHLECDGDSNGLTVVAQVPCAWRDRCVGLKMFCAETGHKPSAVKEALGTGLNDLCRTQVEKLAIVNGQITKGLKVEKKPVAKTEKSPVKAPSPKKDGEKEFLVEIGRLKEEARAQQDAALSRPSRRRKGRFTEALQEPLQSTEVIKPLPVQKEPQTRVRHPQEAPKHPDLVAYFGETLKSAFPGNLPAKPGRVVVTDGTLFNIDRMDTSRYVRWYVEVTGSRPQAVACVWPKKRTSTLDVAIPATLEDLESALTPDVIASLNIEPRIDGQFNAICKGLGADGVDKLVEVLKSLSGDRLNFLRSC